VGAFQPFIRSQRRFGRAFPLCFVGVSGWGICAKNWQLALAVSVMLKRHPAFALEQGLRTAGRRAGEPGAALDTNGRSRHRTDGKPLRAAAVNAEVRLVLCHD
jgi:hypothetical protein